MRDGREVQESGSGRPLLKIDSLIVSYRRAGRKPVKAVDQVTISLNEGETLALVGESASGKTTLAMAVAGLLPRTARVESGSMSFDSIDLINSTPEFRRQICGERIGVIFQDALSYLNPVRSVGWQIGEAFRRRRRASASEASRHAVRLMSEVEIPAPEQKLSTYPHELSGGMRQRVMTGIALSQEPQLLIADEPTTALDVTIQAQVLDLLRRLRDSKRMSLLFITHDLGVAAEIADNIGVMYAGKLVELGPPAALFRNPRHPYTAGLLESMPGRRGRQTTAAPFASIPGNPPDLTDPPTGCRFHPRCQFATNRCREEEPALLEIDGTRKKACHLDIELKSGS